MDYPIPITSRLFKGMTREEASQLLSGLGAEVKHYPRGAYVVHEGDPKVHFGVVLDGELTMYETDADGRRSLVGCLRPPNCVALTFAFAGLDRHPATVKAKVDSTLLRIPVARVQAMLGSSCDAIQRRFLGNLTAEICELAWDHRFRTYLLSRRSTRERVLTYLRRKMRDAGSHSFTIPVDRNGMADYLCVDRSALSVVLSRLKDEGIITYVKNRFTVTKPSEGDVYSAK